jgi:integral membrane protein
MTAMRAPDPTLVRRVFVAVAFVEAFTWAGLLVGMYLEHVAGVTELGVWLFGRLHGAAFLAYVATALVAAWTFRWSVRVTLLALLASVPPLATAAFEVWARRRGHLDVPRAGGTGPDDEVADRVAARARA